MDANNLDFWMLSTAADWLPAAGSDTLYYCAGSNCLQLRSVRLGAPPVEDFTAAAALVETCPMARDGFGTYARWDPASHTVLAGGVGAGEVPIYTPPAGQAVTDLAMGEDGVLYAAVAGTLVLVDRRNRWPAFTLADPAFTFWRLRALAQGGVIALDRIAPQLGVVTGLPLQVEPSDTPNPGVLRSCQANADPPRIHARYALQAGEDFVALALMPGGRVCLLSWASAQAGNTAAFLRVHDKVQGLSSAYALSETHFPYAVQWLDEARIAILATGLNEALIYDLQGASRTLAPAGDTYVLQSRNAGPFVQGSTAPPYYAVGTTMYPLLPLSLNALARSGSATAPRLIDSGSSLTTWHRLLLEAILPPRCGVLIELAATNDAADFSAGAATWFPHVFGAVDPGPLAPETPSATWLPIDCEVAFAPAMLPGPPIPNRQGLFMVLAQRADRAVRNLTGRFLGIRVTLSGDRRSTPQIAALRVYASRFSYVGHYLPALYRENKFGPDADAVGRSTHRDFLERFTGLFEAQMTRIEDRIAGAYLLTRPESAPAAALDWLGSWIGVSPAGYPPDRRRARLLAAPDLHRERGTVSGIRRAIDVATGGMCTRGTVLVLEAFRMRHIFATILGADLAIASDPLLPGTSGNSNSFVGDTLFLGDPRNRDFLALFAETVSLPGQAAATQQFLDSLAWRITVFVHTQVEPADVNLIARIVDHEKPAHVAASIQTAAQPFMIGLASLLGVNSYLAPEPAPHPAVVDVTQVGRYNTIQHVPSLDPRWENGVANVV